MFNAKALAATPHGACVLSMLAIIGAVAALKAWLRLANGIWIYFLRPGKDLKKLGEFQRKGRMYRASSIRWSSQERSSRAVERGDGDRAGKSEQQQQQERHAAKRRRELATMRASDRIEDHLFFLLSPALSFLFNRRVFLTLPPPSLDPITSNSLKQASGASSRAPLMALAAPTPTRSPRPVRGWFLSFFDC